MESTKWFKFLSLEVKDLSINTKMLRDGTIKFLLHSHVPMNELAAENSHVLLNVGFSFLQLQTAGQISRCIGAIVEENINLPVLQAAVFHWEITQDFSFSHSRGPQTLSISSMHVYDIFCESIPSF